MSGELGFRVLGRARDFPRETHDRVNEIVTAALREVGYEPGSWWDESQFMYRHRHKVPADIHAKAAVLACEALGIPIVVEDSP